jgi:WD40 repeat protein
VFAEKAWFSPGDRYLALTGSDGNVRTWDLSTMKKTEDSLFSYDDYNYDYITTLCWENDSSYLAGSAYYYITRGNPLSGPDSTFYIGTYNNIAEIKSIPAKNLVISSSDDGFLNFYDNLEGYRLGLPFIFKGMPQVVGYDTVSGECMIYVNRDGFYRIRPFMEDMEQIVKINSLTFDNKGEYIFNDLPVLAGYDSGRSVEKIPLNLDATSFQSSYPDLLGEWSFIYNFNEVINEERINLDLKIDSSHYSGYYSWPGLDADSPWISEPVACSFDPYTRILEIRFTGEYNGMDMYIGRAYVSDEGTSLHFGTAESLDQPGYVFLNWTGKWLGRSQPSGEKK